MYPFTRAVSAVVVSVLIGACTSDKPSDCAYITQRVDRFYEIEGRVDSRSLEESVSDLTEFLRTLDSVDSEDVKKWQGTLQDFSKALSNAEVEETQRLREFAKREAEGLRKDC